MDIRKEEFPVALQAYNVSDKKEEFIAEQVVNTQAEAEGFMSRFAGKLIKTRDLRPAESTHVRTTARTRRGFPAWAVFLIVVIILIAIAYATGWLQVLFPQIQ